MDNAPITRAEHEEFRRRLEEENTRQNKRITVLEETVRQINILTISVEKLALSVESMVKEQKEQGRKLEILESRDGEKWRTVSSYVLTAIAGAVAAFILSKIGL
ncbi:MAG: hypothetical protein ACLU6W_05405 [Lachnospiraceae bacterium]